MVRRRRDQVGRYSEIFCGIMATIGCLQADPVCARHIMSGRGPDDRRSRMTSHVDVKLSSHAGLKAAPCMVKPRGAVIRCHLLVGAPARHSRERRMITRTSRINDFRALEGSALVQTRHTPRRWIDRTQGMLPNSPNRPRSSLSPSMGRQPPVSGLDSRSGVSGCLGVNPSLQRTATIG